MRLRSVLVTVVGAATLYAAGLPRLAKQNGKYTLLVDDKPYLVLGAQVHNSSGWPRVMAGNWAMLKNLHCNTVAAPVYWEAVEPRPGEFDFAAVDGIIEGARQNGFRLILLWFGTWKNGNMDYTPPWVKENPARYPRMLNSAGRPIRVLSPHAKANADADSRAFAALLGHLREFDGERNTVIMVQVENEAGSLGSDRDYSEAANKAFDGPVPDIVLTSLKKKPGDWKSVFGADAPEVFQAYHVARYINQVAEAGKKAYPLLMYVNVWPREQVGFLRAGETYPSGGAVSNLLDMWKAVAPAIDILAPDIYDSNFLPYRTLCQRYQRPDNPLLVPETGSSVAHARHMFYIFGEFDGLGIAPFGVDGRGDRLKEIAINYRLLSPAAPALLALRQAGNLRSAVEEEGIANALVSFDRFEAVARFGPVRSSYSGDNGTGNPGVTGRVLVGQLAPNEFLLLGCDANVVFRPKLGDPHPTAQIVTAEEGTFEDGQWKRTRLLNGDETYFGLILNGEGTTLRVKLTSY